MIVAFHLIAFLVNEYFTPEWQKNAREIARDVVVAMVEADYKEDRSDVGNPLLLFSTRWKKKAREIAREFCNTRPHGAFLVFLSRYAHVFLSLLWLVRGWKQRLILLLH